MRRQHPVDVEAVPRLTLKIHWGGDGDTAAGLDADAAAAPAKRRLTRAKRPIISKGHMDRVPLLRKDTTSGARVFNHQKPLIGLRDRKAPVNLPDRG